LVAEYAVLKPCAICGFALKNFVFFIFLCWRGLARGQYNDRIEKEKRMNM